MVLEDKDAISASGFVWTHWLISDLKRTSVAENESISATDFTQGANTWASALGKFEIEEASFYGGMAPPNNRHRYELIVYALDTVLICRAVSALMSCILPCKAMFWIRHAWSVLMMCDGMCHY